MDVTIYFTKYVWYVSYENLANVKFSVKKIPFKVINSATKQDFTNGACTVILMLTSVDFN